MEFEKLVVNTLLNLYFTVSLTTRFTPTKARNLILTKYLKSKVKDPEYKSIKGHIKILINAGRSPISCLEDDLYKLIYKEKFKKLEY